LPIDPISLNFFRYIIALLSGIHLFGICLGATGIYYRLRDGGGKYKRIKPCEYVGRLGKSTPKLERRVLGPCLITDLPGMPSFILQMMPCRVLLIFGPLNPPSRLLLTASASVRRCVLLGVR
jgi:hypothetical protein